MRILYIHQHFNTPKGADGTRSYEMAKALIARGHEVTMVCGSNARSRIEGLNQIRPGVFRGKNSGIDVIQFQLEYSNYDSLFKRSWKFLQYAIVCIWCVFREPYDLLFATSTPLTAALPGIVMKLCFGKKPFVFEVRDLWPELPKAMGVITNPFTLGLMKLLEWLAYHSADSCIGLSPGIVEGVRRRSPSDLKVTMIPNGCDEIFLSPNLSPKDIQIANPDSFIAVFAGAHGVANGLDSVLDTAAALKRRGRLDITILFIGDGREKPNLQKRKVREELDNCIFMDPVSKLDLVSVLSSVDVGLMILANCPAFYFGTSPNKFFDYIAMGLPVINNYPGWVANMITDNECGYAVPPEDPECFADALESLCDNSEKCLEFGSNAQKLALKNFTRKNQSKKWIQVLEDTHAQYNTGSNKNKFAP